MRECKCEFHKSVSNHKQKWNHDEYRCECKELHNGNYLKDDSIWNPITCDCECNKVCKIDEYLDIKNCSCKKCLFGNLH